MKCLFCGKKVVRGEIFCNSCSSFLLRAPVWVCTKCHSELTVPGKLCRDCTEREPCYDDLFNMGYYGGGMKKIIGLIKFAEFRKTAMKIGEYFGKLFTSYSDKYDFLMAVPMAPKRFHERGFNQSLEIARGFSRSSGISLEKGILERRDTPPFEKLNRDERRRQVARAFYYGKKINLSAGKRILVIDDVYTTGNTINTVSKLLKKAGASKVDAGVIAR